MTPTDHWLKSLEPQSTQAFPPYKLISLAIVSVVGADQHLWFTDKASRIMHVYTSTWCLSTYLSCFLPCTDLPGVCLLTCHVFFLPYDGLSHLSWPPKNSFHFGDCYVMYSASILHPSHLQGKMTMCWGLCWVLRILGEHDSQSQALTIQCIKYCQMVIMAINKTKEDNENKAHWTRWRSLWAAGEKAVALIGE